MGCCASAWRLLWSGQSPVKLQRRRISLRDASQGGGKLDGRFSIGNGLSDLKSCSPCAAKGLGGSVVGRGLWRVV
ncbi:hypothetical protein M404DRAFT_601444 [Pisolithus tinctorius Marx 270]|uniref:Uncharacterized protein n=1 Tax=Pisolithus tinctorius Marx 270 TaxID=870435 RepID=A0A0C3K3H1_PISTI|nr:hypothetical protein M404DRAFT_601444 [Pisolithus tinctorius Marx 270]